MISSMASFRHVATLITGTRIQLCFAVMVAVCCFCGCGQNPKVDVSVSVEDGQLVFHVPRSDTNGLLEFRVEDDARNVLWSIRLGYEKGENITYGQLPARPIANMAPEQLVPLDDAPPPEIWGRRISVIARYQYDEFMAPSTGTFTKIIQIPEKSKKSNP